MTRKQMDLPQYMLQGFTLLYLSIMIGVFPFYFNSWYLDIGLAKKNFFQTVSVIFLLLILLFLTVSVFRNVRGISVRHIISDISLTDVMAMLFLAVTGISSSISPAGQEAFWGTEGRRLGGLFLILCVCVYFAVSRYYRENSWLLWIFLLTGYGMCLIVILQFWGFDMFQMYENLAAHQHAYFMGTMGNINLNAGYFGVVTALFMSLYYTAQERLSRICFGIAVVMGIYVCYCTRSDSWLLAVGAALFLLLVYSVKEQKKMEKWMQLALFFVGGSICMKVTEILMRMTGKEQIFIEDLCRQRLLYLLISPWVIGGELLILAGIFCVVKSRYMKFIAKYGRGLLAVLLGVGVVAAVVIVIQQGDGFGTNRGYIWRRTLWNFKELPVAHKLFGYGPNCFLPFMEENYGAEMRRLYGKPFLDAHNESLQFLAVTGILGAFSYLGIQCSLFLKCLKRAPQKGVFLIGAVGIAAYVMQGMVNNPQVFTTPLYFLFLGIIENKIRNKKKYLSI